MSIDPKIFELLRHHDPEERKRGIKALARTEDREALRYLASLYNQELDPEVRDLALKAGQHIKKRGELAQWGEDQGKNAAKFVDVEIKRDAPKQKSKLPADAKTTEAKALMDKAMDLVMQSNYADAQDLAYQAFALVPNLDSEPYYATLASDIMGLSQAEAIATLRAGREDYEVGSGKAKRKRGTASGDTPSWGEFLVDMAILYVATAGAVLFFMVLLFNQLQSLATAGYFNDLSTEMSNADITTQFASFVATSGLTIAIVAGLVAGLVVVFANLLHFVVLHFCATMLAGAGSFRGLVHKAIIPLTVQSLVSVAIMGASMYISFQAVIETQGNIALMSMDTANTLNSLNMFSSLLGFGYTLWLSYIIGQNYDFGFGKGCGSIIISYIVIFAVSFCGGFIFISALSG